MKVVTDELRGGQDQYGDERRTEILDGERRDPASRT